MTIKTRIKIFTLFTFVFAFGIAANAQTIAKIKPEANSPEKTSAIKPSKAEEAEANPAGAARESKMKYRRLQSNGLLVETAYLQDEDEMQHSFTIRRDRENYWASEFNSEIPLGSSRHQLTLSVPAQFVSRAVSDERGAGDVRVEYAFTAFGNNASRVTVSPRAGLSLPTGEWRKGFGTGAPGVGVSVPVSYIFTKNFGGTTSAGANYFRKAKNELGENASPFSYEVGQSLVWYAKPRLNLLVEGVWERSQKVAGEGIKQREDEVFLSPGVRWAHRLPGGTTLMPGVAVPIGVGPSRGNNGVMFYLAFEHPFKKKED